MQTRVKIKEIMKQLGSTFVDRDQAIECVWLALLTKQNFILVGDPGTAKTALVNAAYAHVQQARVFSTLCGSFATENKIFGPTDIKAFQEGKYRICTEGRLADCDFAFLDEMLKSNEGTLNGMLTALNERTFEGHQIALRTCGAATNWPEVKSRSENVAALWDRVLLRCEVRDIVEEKKRIQLLEAIDKVRDYAPAITVTMAELDQAFAEIQAVKIDRPVRASLVAIQGTLEKQKVHASSRRYGALQLVLRALAWLDGRDQVLLDDFDALSFGLWSDRDQIEPVQTVVDSVDHQVVQECLQKLRDAIGQCRGNATPTAVPRLLQLAASAAKEARLMLEQRGARRAGRAQIKHEIDELRKIYDQLRGKVAPRLASKKGEEADDAAL